MRNLKAFGLFAVVLLAAACGSKSPVGPSNSTPTPVPSLVAPVIQAQMLVDQTGLKCGSKPCARPAALAADGTNHWTISTKKFGYLRFMALPQSGQTLDPTCTINGEIVSTPTDTIQRLLGMSSSPINTIAAPAMLPEDNGTQQLNGFMVSGLGPGTFTFTAHAVYVCNGKSADMGTQSATVQFVQ